MTELDSSRIKELAEEASTFELFIQYLEDDLEIDYTTLDLDDQILVDMIWNLYYKDCEETEDKLPHSEKWYERMAKKKYGVFWEDVLYPTDDEF